MFRRRLTPALAGVSHSLAILEQLQRVVRHWVYVIRPYSDVPFFYTYTVFWQDYPYMLT